MEEIINRLSRELGIPPKIITSCYTAYWKFIKTTIENMQLKKDLSEEEFKKLRTSFNIPNLGKLCCTYRNYTNVRKRYKMKQENVEYKESKTVS